MPCFPSCKSRLPAPHASLSLKRFAAALSQAASAVDPHCCQSSMEPPYGSSLARSCLCLPPACFRPGREVSWETPQVLSRVAQPPSIARRALGQVLRRDYAPLCLAGNIERIRAAGGACCTPLAPLGRMGQKQGAQSAATARCAAPRGSQSCWQPSTWRGQPGR